MQVQVNRKNLKFSPDSSRTIARFLYTGDERALNTIRSVLSMTKIEASQALIPVLGIFLCATEIFQKFSKDILKK